MEDFVIYACWICGRTSKWPPQSDSTPIAECAADGAFYQMDKIKNPRTAKEKPPEAGRPPGALQEEERSL